MNKISVKCTCGQERRYALVPLDNSLATRMLNLGAMPGETAQFDVQAMAWRGDNAETLARQPDPYASREIEAPARAASIESDVKVPLAQSIIGGLFVGAGLTCTWLYFGWRQPILGPGALTFGAIGLFWSGGVREMRSHLWRVEKLINRDLNKDGAVGKPEKETVLSPFPINDRNTAKSDSTPEPEPAAQPAPKSTRPTGDTPIMIRAGDANRSPRIVKLSDVWEFLKSHIILRIGQRRLGQRAGECHNRSGRIIRIS